MLKASIGTKISLCWYVSGLNREENPPLVCAIEFDNFVKYIVTIYILFIYFLWLITAVLQHRFHSIQVQWKLKFILEIFAHELPQVLPNDVRLRILRNQEILGKSQNQMRTTFCQLFSPEMRFLQYSRVLLCACLIQGEVKNIYVEVMKTV